MALITFAFFEALFYYGCSGKQIELCGHLTQQIRALDKELLQLNILWREACRTVVLSYYKVLHLSCRDKRTGAQLSFFLMIAMKS